MALSLVLSATSTSATITFPSGIQAGDLIVMLDTAQNGSIAAPSNVTPSGFTLIGSSQQETSAFIRQTLSYKLATGSESGSLTGMNGATDSKVMAVFRESTGALNSATPNTFTQQSTSGNPTSQNVVASGGTPPLIVFGAYSAGAGVSPRTMSPAEDGELNASTRSYLKYKIYDTSPADHSVDMDDEGGNILSSGFIAVLAPLSATASLTEANDSLASATTVDVFAAASLSQAADSIAATATVDVFAAAGVTEDDDALESGGVVGVSEVLGEADLIEDDDASSAVVLVNDDYTASLTEDDATVAATAAVDVAATSALTEADDTSAAAGTVDVVAAASLTEADDTLAAEALVDIAATANGTEADDSVASVYIVNDDYAAAVVEDDDALSASFISGTTAAADLIEDDDTLAALATVLVVATSGTIEDDDGVGGTIEALISIAALLVESDDTVTAEETGRQLRGVVAAKVSGGLAARAATTGDGRTVRTRSTGGGMRAF